MQYRCFIILSMFLSCVFVGSSLNAATDRLNCGIKRHVSADTMVCRNQDESFPVEVSYRRMPGWGRHSSLLLVNICEMEVEDLPFEEIKVINPQGETVADIASSDHNGSVNVNLENHLPSTDGSLETTEEQPAAGSVVSSESQPLEEVNNPQLEDPSVVKTVSQKWTPKSCRVRFCSEDGAVKAFSVNAIPIPLSAFVVRFWFSRRTTQYEMKCNTII